MGRLTWDTNDSWMRRVMAYIPYLRPGQFELRWPSKCSACGVRIARGDAAGYMDNEIVCDDCYA